MPPDANDITWRRVCRLALAAIVFAVLFSYLLRLPFKQSHSADDPAFETSSPFAAMLDVRKSTRL